MSGDAASLPCPICSHTGVFESAQSLRDKLIHVSNNTIMCPVCQEEICGLDKLTIHLFTHVKLLSPVKKNAGSIKAIDKMCKLIPENEVVQQKKPRSVAKNKRLPPTASAPVKYVKIYPKLPVISLKPVLPVIDISAKQATEGTQNNEQLILKTEAQVVQTNTTCDMCGLQFVDKNILKMHRCIIHNIDDTSSQSITRYNCHLCPKHFKMRGSLMVHLRVAHYGFLTENRNNDIQNNTDQLSDQCQEKCSNVDRNDNKQWQCDVCKKYFTTKYFLKKHKRLHTGETPYACTQCNKTFTFQQSYHKHLLYHNDEKPHTCSFCGRSFKELSTLHNHQRIHTGEKPFACETCGKCFRQRVSYLVHRRIHTGVMPYKCTACEKSFRYKVSQRTHKCQAQPPGTVVRQTGNLVEKLKRKHKNPDNLDNHLTRDSQTSYQEISEVNAEMARTGAKLSLEDLESESFRILAESYNDDDVDQQNNTIFVTDIFNQNTNKQSETNAEELNPSNPAMDKNIPSPSDIFKNLCLSNDDDFMLNEERNTNTIKDLTDYL